MKVEMYYQKKPNFNMTSEDAAKLTLAQLADNYELVLKIDMPEGTLPDKIYNMYQDRPLYLPPGIHHTSMSAGDIVILGETVCVCCYCGWYRIKFSNIPSGDTIEAS